LKIKKAMIFNIKNPKQHLRIEVDGKMTGLSSVGKKAIKSNNFNDKERIGNRKAELNQIIKWFKKQLQSFLSLGGKIEDSEELKFLLEITFRSYIKDMKTAANQEENQSENNFVFANAYWYFNKLIIQNGNFLQSEQDLLKLVESVSIKKEGINNDAIRPLIQRIENEIKTGTIQYGYLKKLNVRGYFGLEDIEIEGLSRTKEIYFLGENGDGKTLLLQSIVLAFLSQYIKNEADKGDVGEILQNIADNKNLFIAAEDDKRNHYGNTKAILKNVYAYGTNRQSNTDTENYDKEGYLTLFPTERSLLSPVTWLKDIQLKGEKSVIKLEAAKKMLSDLLDEDVEIETDLGKIHFKDVRFTERGTVGLHFEQLSDGYKSVMTWTADLVARMAKNQPEAKQTKDFKGIVLVDEIGLHLHPRWEAGLVKKLRKWFPKIQFFFTTHSPIMILNADKNAVFYRLYKEEGVTKISGKFYCKDFSDLRLNSLVTSPLFGLDDASMESFDPEIDELDTSENFMTNRIRKIVKEKVAALKAENRTVLSVDFLDDLIKSAMEQID
jgi:predicted ATP-binding protein involved in virulence